MSHTVKLRIDSNYRSDTETVHATREEARAAAEAIVASWDLSDGRHIEDGPLCWHLCDADGTRRQTVYLYA